MMRGEDRKDRPERGAGSEERDVPVDDLQPNSSRDGTPIQGGPWLARSLVSAAVTLHAIRSSASMMARDVLSRHRRGVALASAAVNTVPPQVPGQRRSITDRGQTFGDRWLPEVIR